MKPDKRAMLGMPGYGPMSATAAGSFWRCTSTPDQLIRTYREGSLLAATFNTLWCDALNYKLVDGQQLDYFAMQHSDIGAEDCWLDTLIEEMEERNLDVLGVVVPIKDMRGLTSIAMERPDGDPWRPLCRLTMQEAFRLPETFTAEDAGHPLLLNTGLWVCRFTEELARSGLYFTVNDAVIYDTNLKRFIPKCESEDWHFSRQINRKGFKIGATRKVRVVHRGNWEFGNAEPWGDNSFDKEHLLKGSVIPDDGFRFPFDVPGWLTHNEGRSLFKLAKGKRVLEIGSYFGLSTICLAQSADVVVSVDTHDGRGTAIPQDTYGGLLANVSRYGLANKVQSHISTARQFAEDVAMFHPEDGDFDLIFIDGAHDYASVESDINDALSLLSPNGLIAFHDYRSPIDPDVTKAVDEFLSAGAELVSTHDSLAVVRPPAAVLLEA